MKHILDFISKNDKEKGVTLAKISRHFGVEIGKKMIPLLNSGEVYEIKPNVFKRMQ